MCSRRSTPPAGAEILTLAVRPQLWLTGQQRSCLDSAPAEVAANPPSATLGEATHWEVSHWKQHAKKLLWKAREAASHWVLLAAMQSRSPALRELKCCRSWRHPAIKSMKGALGEAAGLVYCFLFPTEIN